MFVLPFPINDEPGQFDHLKMQGFINAHVILAAHLGFSTCTKIVLPEYEFNVNFSLIIYSPKSVFMKPINSLRNDRVPWMVHIFSVFALLLSSSMGEQAFSQGYLSDNRYSVNNAKPVAYLRLNEVNRDASRHFRDHFLSNGHEKWIRDNGFYIASFNDASVMNKVYYNMQGAFEYYVKSYGADALNKELKTAVLKKFEGYYIKTVMEISNLENEIYFIKIVTATNIKTLKCFDGKIEITEDYINGGI